MTGKPAAPADDPHVRVRFLKAVEKLGCVSAAAAVAGVQVRSFYRLRKTDPEFADAWDNAILIARGDLEDLLRRRFTEGVDWTVRRNGGVVTVTRKFSDRLGEYVHKVLERRAEKIEAQWGEDDKLPVTMEGLIARYGPLETVRRHIFVVSQAYKAVRESGNAADIAMAEKWLGHSLIGGKEDAPATPAARAHPSTSSG